MKLFSLLIAITMLAIGIAYADSIPTQHENNAIVVGFSGAASGSGIYAANATRGNPINTRATVSFYGYSAATSTAAVSFSGGTMNGTYALLGGPTATGPWSPVKDAFTNTAVTGTSNMSWNIDTYFPFYTVTWTRNGNATHFLSSYLYYGR